MPSFWIVMAIRVPAPPMETARCLGSSGDSVKLASVAKRLIALDLLAADNVAANKHFEAYQAAGGKGIARLAPQPLSGARLYQTDHHTFRVLCARSDGMAAIRAT